MKVTAHRRGPEFYTLTVKGDEREWEASVWLPRRSDATPFWFERDHRTPWRLFDGIDADMDGTIYRRHCNLATPKPIAQCTTLGACKVALVKHLAKESMDRQEGDV